VCKNIRIAAVTADKWMPHVNEKVRLFRLRDGRRIGRLPTGGASIIRLCAEKAGEL
jgi:hypothetical protein